MFYPRKWENTHRNSKGRYIIGHDIKNLQMQMKKEAEGAALVNFCTRELLWSSVGDGLPLDLEVVEFDGIVVEDLLPLLLREVGDQLLQQAHHLQSHQISDGKLISTKISLKTKAQQQLFQWTYLEVSQVWDSSDVHN